MVVSFIQELYRFKKIDIYYMKYYVGIDLGTTNSAICMYDGEHIHVLKSPEQNDVTPSAILVDKRGNKYIGKRAYDAAPGSPDNAALLFKRFMGSNTKFSFRASGEIKSALRQNSRGMTQGGSPTLKSCGRMDLR